MDEQKVKIFDGGDEPVWITVAEYLQRYIGALEPLSVGQCFRFRMGGAEDIEPAMDMAMVMHCAAEGRAGAYIVPDSGIILVLPTPVEVSVTFDGDHIIQAARLDT